MRNCFQVVLCLILIRCVLQQNMCKACLQIWREQIFTGKNSKNLCVKSSPLKEVFSYLPHAEYPRIVFCVTDGEVNNTSQVIQLVKNSAGSTRVFTLG